MSSKILPAGLLQAERKLLKNRPNPVKAKLLIFIRIYLFYWSHVTYNDNIFMPLFNIIENIIMDVSHKC